MLPISWLLPQEKEHFATCSEYEIFDRRSLDEVLFHTDHKQRLDIQYSARKAALRHFRHVRVLVIIWRPLADHPH